MRRPRDRFLLAWSGTLIPRRGAVRRFVFASKRPIRLVNGLTYGFLFAIARELYYARPDGGRSRVQDVTRVARRPASQEELDGLHFAPFDVLEIDGTKCRSFPHGWDWLSRVGLPTPPAVRLPGADDILKQFRAWTEAGHEGAVIRSDAAGCYKLKPRHTIDAAVIGFTEGIDDRRGLIHDLLVALMRADGTFQVLGRVGGGFTDEDRRNWLCDLQDLVVGSDYVEANDGVAYRMVWPRWVIEISILDLIAQSTRGAPIPRMVLDWEAAAGDDHAVGCWRSLRKLPLATMISPHFVRRREDKSVNPVDVRPEQITALVDVPLADRDARRVTLPMSAILRRAVYTKQQKGQTMVRKLVMWQTNKAEACQGSGVGDFPAYVIAFTDYSPSRKTPLERDIRVSNSREQIDDLWRELVKENIVTGWAHQDPTAVRRAG